MKRIKGKILNPSIKYWYIHFKNTPENTPVCFKINVIRKQKFHFHMIYFHCISREQLIANNENYNHPNELGEVDIE